MSLIKSLAMIVIAAAIVFHALVPRYEVTVERSNSIVVATFTRIDRWTGNVEYLLLSSSGPPLDSTGTDGADGDWLTVTFR